MTYCALIIDNRDWVEPIIKQHERFIPKGWPVYWIKDEQTNAPYEYNKLLTSKRLWRTLPDKVLIFQHDSMLLRPGVEDFLEWNFVGAPIKNILGCMNGGLSLRDRKAMLRVIDSLEWSPQLGNEDVYFCNELRKLGGNLPPIETAMQFSVETMYYPTPIGYHAMDKYLTKEQCRSIRENTPMEIQS